MYVRMCECVCECTEDFTAVHSQFICRSLQIRIALAVTLRLMEITSMISFERQK